MSKVKHTPGPWQVVDSYDEDCKIIVWDGDEQAHAPICDMGELGDMNYADALANATLIATAPKLLESLVRIIDRIEENNLQDHFPSAYKRAKAVIKKATN